MVLHPLKLKILIKKIIVQLGKIKEHKLRSFFLINLK